MSWKSSRRQFLQQSLLAAASPVIFFEKMGTSAVGEFPQCVVSGFQKTNFDCPAWRPVRLRSLVSADILSFARSVGSTCAAWSSGTQISTCEDPKSPPSRRIC